MNKDLLDEILSDIEKSSIQAFVENEIQREAVRKVILAGIYYNGVLKKGKKANPLTNFAMSIGMNEKNLTNEQKGELLSACTEGVRLLEVGFNHLSKFKKDEPKPKVINKAR